MELTLLLENLRGRFNVRRFKPSDNGRRRHSGLRDAFFETTFQRTFVDSRRSGHDDLLFYVMYDQAADKDSVEVMRRDSKTLPSSVDPLVLWDKTLYLNVILHEFDYHVTCSVITLKPSSDSISTVKHTVKLKVFPSPTERRMDKKDVEGDVIYPDIMFCVDSFEEIFGNIKLTTPGEKVAVQLMAVNKSCRVSRMVFLGAVDYTALKTECIKRDHNSLKRRIKRLSLTRNSSNSKVNDLSSTYSFVKMHGPKLKGFAEMAVAKSYRNTTLVPPGTHETTVVPPSTSHTAPLRLPESNGTPRLVVAAKNGAQLSPRPVVPEILVVRDHDSEYYAPSPIHVRSSSSPAPMPVHVRSYSSPVDTASAMGYRLEPDEAYSTASPSRSSIVEAENFRRMSRPGSGVITRHDSRDSFLSNDSALDDRHERSQSFSGPMRNDDTVSVASSSSRASTASTRERLKQGFRRMSRSKSGSDLEFPVSAYLTYITLPWYCIVDDILNSTRKRVL